MGNFEKRKKLLFFSHVTRITQRKNQIPRSKGVLSNWRTDGHTDRHTHTKVNTEDTLSGFQELFLQPVIKDRSNMFTVDSFMKHCRASGGNSIFILFDSEPSKTVTSSNLFQNFQ